MTKTIFALPLALLGCATTSVVSPPAELNVPALEDALVTYSEWSENVQAVASSLEALQGLEVIEVGELLVNAQEGSGNCYGPCQDDPADQLWMAEHARQTARLQAFVQAAESAVEASPAPSAEHDEALEALNALAIVEVTGIVNARSCYGPCDGEEDRIGVAVALADATQNL